jgi:hypothetical protein
VRDDDERARRPRHEALEQRQAVEVEVVRRLVEQQDVGIGVEDLAQRGPPGLAAGPLGTRTLLREVPDGKIPRAAGDAARVGSLEPREHPQQGRLAAAVRTEHADPRPGRNDERDAVEDDVGTVAHDDVRCGERAAHATS